MKLPVRTVTFAVCLMMISGALPALAGAVSPRAPGPDLIIYAWSWGTAPADPHVGQNVTVNVTIANIGNQDANGDFNVSFYLNDTSTPLCPANNVTVNGLIKDAIFNVWTLWDTTGLAAGINYTILAVVDSLDTVAEGDETNNNFSQNQSLLPPAYPDAVVSSVELDPAVPYIGDNVRLNVSVSNIGDWCATYTDVYFYIDNNSNPISQFETVNDNHPLETQNVTTVWNTSGFEERLYDILIVLNPNWSTNRIIESNYSNNEYRVAVNLTVAPVNLTLLQFNITPAQPRVADLIELNCTLRNDGVRPISELPASFYFDAVKVGTTNLTLGMGQTGNIALTFPSSEYAVGNHTARLLLGNLNHSRTVTLLETLRANLLLRNASFQPADPKVGQSVMVSAEVVNTGHAPSSECNVSLYIDYTIEPVGAFVLTSLQPDEIRSVMLNWNTTGATPMVHRLRVIADSEYSVIEENETDNTATLSVNLTGEIDLAVDNLTIVPSEPRIGDGVVFTVRVRNNGTLRCTSANLTIRIGGAVSDQKKVMTLASGGVLERATLNWSTTGLAAGTYDYEIKVAVGAEETENNTADNVLRGNITLLALTPRADLKVRAIGLSPGAPRTGDDLTLAVLVENIGTGDANASSMMVFLELGNSKMKFTDSAVAVPAMAAGRAVTVNVTRNTERFPAGTYLLNVTIDVNGDIDELSENNNQFTQAFQLVAPPAKTAVLKILQVVVEGKLEEDQTVTISAIVANTGDADAYNVNLTFIIDGKTRYTYTLPVLGKSSNSTVPFTYSFVRGDHNILVTASGEGLTAATGVQKASVSVPASDPNPVMILAGVGILMLLLVAVLVYSMKNRRPAQRVKLVKEEEE